VAGIVQGVGFRFFAERVASQLGVSGYVKNLRDGRVEVYAIGTSEQLARLRAALQEGPRMASVEEVREDEAPYDPRYAEGFIVERDW